VAGERKPVGTVSAVDASLTYVSTSTRSDLLGSVGDVVVAVVVDAEHRPLVVRVRPL
jgi:uncharacterized protein (UPF0218 family)